MKLPRISRVSRRWKQLGITEKVAVLGLVVAVVSVLVAVVGLVPGFLSLADDSGAAPLTSASSASRPPSRPSSPATTTSTTTSPTVTPTTPPAALKVDAGYSWTTDSIIWAFAKPLPAEDGQAVERPKLGGDAAAQQQLEDRLARRGGIKIGVDSSGDPRPHSEVRLLVTGQHDGAVLITGMRANVTKRTRPLGETIVFGPAEGEGGNIQIGFDLDALSPVARSYDKQKFLAGPYFAAKHVSVKSGEQVLFTVRAFTEKCYCEWELLVEVIVDGRSRVLTVRNGSRPFRTTAFADSYRTIYDFDFFRSRFVRQPPGSKLGG